ncbi:hypothetical protein BDV93DRAFT_40243 [Ceratobasidium sp. AG-I]|nr:hypothetical protein BDV93DRAFT_40243 [Ceratobasidium sp. AG-I]
MSLSHGVYYIRNAGRMQPMDLSGDGNNESVYTNPDNSPTSPYVYNQLWHFKDTSNGTGSYKIRNLATGSYLSLENNGSDARGTRLIGWQQHTCTNEEWVCKNVKDNNIYKIQNVTSRTFVDLKFGGSGRDRQLDVVGWHGTWDNVLNYHQLWAFQKASLSASEINNIVGGHPRIQRAFSNYKPNQEYLVVPRETMLKIWNDSHLGKQKWRKGIFDSDDFAFTLKTEVAKWGARSIKPDGFTILCGVMFGSKTVGTKVITHALNWAIDSSDLRSVYFIDPHYEPKG